MNPASCSENPVSVRKRGSHRNMENVLADVPVNISTTPHPILECHGLTRAVEAGATTASGSTVRSGVCSAGGWVRRRAPTHSTSHGTRAARENTAHDPTDTRHPAASASGTAKKGAVAVDMPSSIE